MKIAKSVAGFDCRAPYAAAGAPLATLGAHPPSHIAATAFLGGRPPS